MQTSARGSGQPRETFRRTLAPLSIAERFVFADQEVAVRAFFLGEFEEDLLALGILETLAVALEELVRAALALDADEQRLFVVHALAQLLGTLGEQPARRAFEEQKRRPRFELRVLRDQFLVALLQRAEVFLFFFVQFLEDGAAARVFGDAGGARVELEAAALGSDCHSERVASEDEFGGGAVDRRRLPAGAALFARAEDLHHLLRRREVARAGDFFHQRFDVGAQELRRTVAGRTDQVIVARVAVRRLEARAPFAEVHL